MTALEMKYKFDIKMRELLKSLNHPFNTAEVNRMLNEAQLKLVKEYADYFDRNEDVKKILSVLVIPYSTTNITPSTTHTNGFVATVPSDVLNIVSEKVNNSNLIKVKPLAHDEYIVNVPNPFKQPDSTNVWRVDMEDKQTLISDGNVQITSYQCNYIRMPNDIQIDGNVDCELQSQIHEDIIDFAIKIALEIINRSLQLNNNKSN